MKTLEDLQGMTIDKTLQIEKGQALILTDGTVVICRDMHIAHPLVQAAALKKAYGWGRPPKSPQKVKTRPVAQDAAPFIPTTVAEEAKAAPLPQFDMGPDRPWMDKVEGMARPTSADKVEDWG